MRPPSTLTEAEKTEKTRLYMIEYRAKNKDRLTEKRIEALPKARAWYRQNREKRLAEQAEYRKNNRERERLRSRAYKAANPEKVRAAGALARSKNPEKRLAAQRARHAANPEKGRAATKSWRSRNLLYVKGKAAEWYVANREKSIERTRAWRIAHPKEIKAKNAAWMAKNPGKCKEYNDRARARRAGASVGDIAIITAWELTWRTSRYVTCYWCRGSFQGKKCQADHIIPLSKDGPHEIGNMCISCAPCNHTKNARSFAEWNARLVEPTMF